LLEEENAKLGYSRTKVLYKQQCLNWVRKGGGRFAKESWMIDIKDKNFK
jgi:hypothetical protein